MTLPDHIPSLFDDLIDNLNQTSATEEAREPASSPPSQDMNGGDVVTDQAEANQTSPEAQALSSNDDLSADVSPAPASSEGFLRLSEILRETEFSERAYIIVHYEDAVRRGTIQAVVLEGQSFQVRYWQGDSSTRRTLQDELIRQTPELDEWLRVQRMESRYAYRAATGNVGTSLEHLQSGRDDFQRLAKLRRQLLNHRNKEDN